MRMPYSFAPANNRKRMDLEARPSRRSHRSTVAGLVTLIERAGIAVNIGSRD
jgi:hypothetical protein